MSNPELWVAFLTLTLLEIVLGIDNIIMLTILVGRLPKKEQAFGRFFGLSAAMVTRIALLLSLSWIMKLTEPLVTILTRSFSGRDLILIVGGLFLVAKSTHEIHHTVEGSDADPSENTEGHAHKEHHSKKRKQFLSVIIQIGLVDIVFSLDSVITAVGLVDKVSVMIAAIIASMFCMMIAAKYIGDFVDKHPTIKMLALSFLILIGFILIADGFDLHIPKGYAYCAMAFSMAVEALNIRMRSKRESV